MNKTIALSATILTLLVSTAAPARPPWADHGMAPDRRIERMTEKLDLTSEQQANIRAILETHRAQRNAERAVVRGQIDTVLTEEQRAERDARFDRRIERRVARIADHLDLSADQETELRALMGELRDNPNWTRNERRERLLAVLTGDQLAELEEMRWHRGPRVWGGCEE